MGKVSDTRPWHRYARLAAIPLALTALLLGSFFSFQDPPFFLQAPQPVRDLLSLRYTEGVPATSNEGGTVFFQPVAGSSPQSRETAENARHTSGVPTDDDGSSSQGAVVADGSQSTASPQGASHAPRNWGPVGDAPGTPGVSSKIDSVTEGQVQQGVQSGGRDQEKGGSKEGQEWKDSSSSSSSSREDRGSGNKASGTSSEGSQAKAMPKKKEEDSRGGDNRSKGRQSSGMEAGRPTDTSSERHHTVGDKDSTGDKGGGAGSNRVSNKGGQKLEWGQPCNASRWTSFEHEGKLVSEIERPHGVLYLPSMAEGARKVISGQATGLPTWTPRPDHYLVIMCFYGQISNRLRCIRHHLIMAGLLNRTLIVNSESETVKINMNYTWAPHLDIAHAQRCFGPTSVVSSQQFLKQRRGKKLPLDLFLCYFRDCRLGYASSYSSFLELPLRAPYRELRAETLDELVQRATAPEYHSAKTIILGELFFLESLLPGKVFQYGDVPFKRLPGCPNALALLPEPSVVGEALAAVRALFKGQPFLGFHWRRGDFGFFCTNATTKFMRIALCVTPDQVAECLAHEASRHGMSNALICHMMGSHRVDQLAIAVSKRLGRRFTIFHNPLPRDIPKRHEDANMKITGFQKIMLAHSAIFIGTPHSTFTTDIMRLRLGYGTASCHDQFIGQGFLY